MDFGWLSASSLCRASKRVQSARGECGTGGESEQLCKQEEEEKEEEDEQQQQQRRNYISLKNSGIIDGLPNCDHLVNP